MKKLLNIALVMAVLATGIFTSCMFQAVPDDGTHPVFTWKPGSNSNEVGGNVPFKTFEGCDLQIWSNSFTASTTSEAEEFTVGSAGWWGGAFVNNGAVSPTTAGCVTYDMSQVVIITCQMKSTTGAVVWLATSDSSATLQNKTEFSTTSDWKEYTLKVASGTAGKKDYGVLGIGGGNDSGAVVSIKDIAFWNADGIEIVPSAN